MTTVYDDNKKMNLTNITTTRKVKKPVYDDTKMNLTNITTTRKVKKFPYPVHFISYSDGAKFNVSKHRLIRQATHSGWFKSAYAYGLSDLPDWFTTKFKEILNLPRGAGYWIWRFPIIEKVLDRIPFGEYVAFIDSDCRVNPGGKTNLLLWLDTLEKSEYDEVSLEMRFKEHHYTTNRLFEAFNVSMNSWIRSGFQYQGGTLLIRNGNHIRKILKAIYEVLDKDPFLITDKYNNESKKFDRTFRENRHDQSMHSIAKKIHGSVVFKKPPGGTDPFPTSEKMKTMSWARVMQMEEKERQNHVWD